MSTPLISFELSNSSLRTAPPLSKMKKSTEAVIQVHQTKPFFYFNALANMNVRVNYPGKNCYAHHRPRLKQAVIVVESSYHLSILVCHHVLPDSHPWAPSKKSIFSQDHPLPRPTHTNILPMSHPKSIQQSPITYRLLLIYTFDLAIHLYKILEDHSVNL